MNKHVWVHWGMSCLAMSICLCVGALGVTSVVAVFAVVLMWVGMVGAFRAIRHSVPPVDRH